MLTKPQDVHSSCHNVSAQMDQMIPSTRQSNKSQHLHQPCVCKADAHISLHKSSFTAATGRIMQCLPCMHSNNSWNCLEPMLHIEVATEGDHPPASKPGTQLRYLSQNARNIAHTDAITMFMRCVCQFAHTCAHDLLQHLHCSGRRMHMRTAISPNSIDAFRFHFSIFSFVLNTLFKVMFHLSLMVRVRYRS